MREILEERGESGKGKGKLRKFLEEAQKEDIYKDELEELKKILEAIEEKEEKNIIQKIEYSLAY